MRKWRVYALLDEDKSVRYVGYTVDTLARRLAGHCNQSRRGGDSHKDRWLRSLLRRGSRPTIQTLESGTGDGWAECERKWIMLFRSVTERLLNHADGGEGAPGRVHSEESRRKRAEAMRGRKMPREGVERQAAKMRGYKWNKEVVERRSAALRGRARATEVCQQISESKKGWNPSPETRANMATAQQRRFQQSNPPRKRTVQHEADNARCKCRDCILSRVGKPGGRKRTVVHDPDNRRCYCMDCRNAQKQRSAAKALRVL